MFIHVVPIININDARKIELISIKLPEYNIEIQKDDLSTGKPFKNKFFRVGSLKSKKAMIGVLIEVPHFLSHFSSVFEWNVSRLDAPIIHTVNCHVLDQEYELVSQDFSLSRRFQRYEPRTSELYNGMADHEKRACILPLLDDDDIFSDKRPPKERRHASVNGVNFVNHQIDELELKTIELQRLDNTLLYSDRYPRESFNAIKNK